MTQTTESQFGADEEQAIIDVVIASRRLIDDNEPEAFAELFAPEVVFDICPPPEGMPLPLLGKDQVVGFLTANRARQGARNPRLHVVSNSVVTALGPDVAQVVSDMAVHEGPTADTPVTGGGRQIDVLTRTDAGWRFTSRMLRAVSS
jgi:hypothetical protein